MPNSLEITRNQAVQAILAAIKEGKKRILVSMPQGSGKVGVIEKTLLEYLKSTGGIYNARILIIADRTTLIDQLSSRLKDSYGENIVSTRFDDPNKNQQILVTTLQHIFSNEEQFYTTFDNEYFDVIILYDCERLGVGKSDKPIRSILEHFTTAIKIGIDFLVQKSILFFGEPVFTLTTKNAIDRNLLVPVKLIAISFEKSKPEYWQGTNDKNFKSLDNKALENFEGSDEYIQNLASSVLETTQREKAIIFCSNKENAHRLSQKLNSITKDETFSRPFISGIDNSILAQTLNDYRSNEKPCILLSVDMLTNGVDVPNVKHIVLAREFKNSNQLQQLIIMGMRTHPGKEYLQVVDYKGNTDIERLIPDVFLTEGQITYDASNKNENKVRKEATITYNKINKSNIVFRDRKSIEGVLGVRDLAEELAEIIKKMPDEKGTMIGIFGRWGRGKTFLMDETWKVLEKSGDVHRVDFHAWKYQDTPGSWAYLYENLSSKYFTGNAIVKFFKTIYLNTIRKRLSPLLYFLATLILGIITVYSIKLFNYDKSKGLEVVVKYLGIPLVGVTIIYEILNYITRSYGSKAKDLFQKYAQKHSFKVHLGIQAEIQEEMVSLLKAWIPNKKVGKNKIVLFVDDIDRCNEERIIQIIDALRIMLEQDEISKRLIVVAAIDETILKRAIKSKYQSSLEVEPDAWKRKIIIQQLTTEYLDKLFITGIKLGNLSVAERDEFFMEFIKNDIEENAPSLETLSNKDNHSDIFPGDYEVIDTPSMHVDTRSDKVKGMQKSNKKQRFEKLTADELGILRNSLKSYNNTTPRQIRIFYYRYLIAKNLLIRQYAKLGTENIWLNPQYIKMFIDLIIAYSQQEDVSEVTQHKVNVLETTAPKVKVFHIENGSANSKDYGELLKVLDIVLAY